MNGPAGVMALVLVEKVGFPQRHVLVLTNRTGDVGGEPPTSPNFFAHLDALAKQVQRGVVEAGVAVDR